MKFSAIAKILPPQMTSVLPRARLFQRVEQSLERQVLWVSGPAGSGKTTLAASYLDASDLSCLWYQLDGGDADIATFFHYFGTALENVFPGSLESLPGFSAEYLPGISVFAKRYFEKFFLTVTTRHPVKDPFFLIFDNYHEVATDALLHSLLANGLTVLPEGIKVMVLSRENPPSSYARLRANGHMSMIAGQELSFIGKECDAMLARNHIVLDTENKDLLLAKSQGWAAGLVLFNESLRSGETNLPILSDFPSPEGLFDYFAEEVYSHIDPEIRDFLVKTVFLSTITPQSAAVATGNFRASVILDELHRRNCFTEKRILPELAYQYHPLFKEFLRVKASQRFTEEDIRRFKRTAAQLLADKDQVEEAVWLLVQAGDWHELVTLLRDHIPAFLARGRGKTVQEWLFSVPAEIRQEHVELNYYLGICRLPFDPTAALDLFESASTQAQRLGDMPWALTAWAEAVNAILYGWNHFSVLDRWIEWLEHHEKADSGTWPKEVEAKVAISMTGALVFRRPDEPEPLRHWLEKALSLSQQLQNPNLQVQIICYALQYFSSLGDVENNDMILLSLRSIPPSSIASPTVMITLKWIEAVSCNWHRSDPDAALAIINDGLKFAEEAGVHSGDHFLFAVGSYSALLKGDLTLAGDFLHRIEETLDGTRLHSFCQYNYIASLYYLRKDNLPMAHQYGERALNYAIESGIYFPVLFCRLGMAQILLEEGDYNQAALHLAEAQQPIDKTQSGILKYSWLLAKARLLFLTMDQEGGLVVLREAMQLAREYGYIWLFWWWHPQSMADLCAIALEQGIEENHVQKIIRVGNLVPRLSASSPSNWPYRLKIFTLGRFEIVREGTTLEFLGKIPRKPLEMLKAMIALGGKGVRDEQLGEILWPESDGDAAHKSFEVTLARLRKLLGESSCISYQGGLVSIESSCCWVDSFVFESCLQASEKLWVSADRSTSEELSVKEITAAILKTQTAVDLYAEFLPGDVHQAWATVQRDRFKNRLLHLLLRLGSHWRENGYWQRALACYVNALDIDELREEVYQAIMICRHQLGQKAEAVMTYHHCRSTLDAHLGITPSTRTEHLYREISGT